MESIQNIFDESRKYFNSGVTKSLSFRKNNLVKLCKAIKENEENIAKALYLDLGKSYQEAYMCEIGLVYQEISYMLKHLKRWSKVKKCKAGLACFPSKAKIYKEPLGQVLIMSPWNYPFLLSIQPLVGSIAGGNTSIVRPSSQAINTSKVIFDLLSKTFPSYYVYPFLGCREEADVLLTFPFNLIFFTGSPDVGKMVMEKASKNLTPVILELGGKSPCIVSKNANLKLAAKRIIFGKTINSGQTCVAPDYLLVDEKVKSSLIEEIKLEIAKQFPNGFLYNEEYPKIISSKKKEHLLSLLGEDKIILGGKSSDDKIEFTLVESSFSSPLMQEEIFGPIMPLITYSSLDDCIALLQEKATPLALYFYSSSKEECEKVLTSLSFGSGAINDCLMQLSSHAIPFGGKGNSGMGQYHGYASFLAFTHQKGVLVSKNMDVPARYHPYTKKSFSLIKKILK